MRTPRATETNYAVSSDGQRFLMVQDANQDLVSTRIVVVLNFVEELKRAKPSLAVALARDP